MRNTTLIAPIRNEIKFISKFLESLLQQDYPKYLLEIFLIDGLSTDGTREIIEQYKNQYEFIKLLDNPYKTVPYALNIGLKHAKGDIIIRLDAHAEYPSNYLSTLVFYLNKLNADNVGAVAETLPANFSLKAKAIAIAMSTSFGVGNATFRIKKKFTDEYIEVDTVPFGCYRRDVFERIGLFDEELTRNQDNEFNERLKKAGGKIYLIPSIKIKYYVRENYSKLFRMFYQYGYFGPLVDIKLKRPTRLRRYIPTLFIFAITLPLILSFLYFPFFYLWLFVVGSYILASVSFSTAEAVKSNSLHLIPYIIWAYFVSHASYGLGYLKGFIDFVILRVNKKTKINVELSR